MDFLVDLSYLFIVEFLLGKGGICYDCDLLLLIIDTQFLKLRLSGEIGVLSLIRSKVRIEVSLRFLLIAHALGRDLRPSEE